MISWQELLRFQAHPDVWLLVVGLGLAYRGAVRAHRQRTGEGVAQRTVVRFVAGLMLLWVASDWPVDDVGERSLLSMHMVQYLLLAMAAPGLLLTGMPAWMLDALLRPRWLRALSRVFVRPWAAWLLVNVVLLFSHWNPVIELYLANDIVHFTMHVAWTASGVALWWPVVSPLPDVPRLTPPGQLGYLLVHSLVPTIPASFLTFGDQGVFAAYAALPKPPGLDVLVDQQVAGLLMKLGGAIILWLVITVIFFRWSASEEHKDVTRTTSHRSEAAPPTRETLPP